MNELIFFKILSICIILNCLLGCNGSDSDIAPSISQSIPSEHEILSFPNGSESTRSSQSSESSRESSRNVADHEVSIENSWENILFSEEIYSPIQKDSERWVKSPNDIYSAYDEGMVRSGSIRMYIHNNLNDSTYSYPLFNYSQSEIWLDDNYLLYVEENRSVYLLDVNKQQILDIPPLLENYDTKPKTIDYNYEIKDNNCIVVYGDIYLNKYVLGELQFSIIDGQIYLQER